MKALFCIVAAAALAGTVAGCADPYYYSYPQYGYSQAYYYPSSYSYPSSYTYYPTYPTTYYPGSYVGSGGYYRNYRGTYPGPAFSMAVGFP